MVISLFVDYYSVLEDSWKLHWYTFSLSTTNCINHGNKIQTGRYVGIYAETGTGLIKIHYTFQSVCLFILHFDGIIKLDGGDK